MERPTNTDIQSTGVEDDPENSLDDSVPISNEEAIVGGTIVTVTEAESSDVKEGNSLPISKEEITSQGNDILTEAESFDEKEANSVLISNEETKAEGSIDTMTEAESADEKEANTLALLDEIKSLVHS